MPTDLRHHDTRKHSDTFRTMEDRLQESGLLDEHPRLQSTYGKKVLQPDILAANSSDSSTERARALLQEDDEGISMDLIYELTDGIMDEESETMKPSETIQDRGQLTTASKAKDTLDHDESDISSCFTNEVGSTIPSLEDVEKILKAKDTSTEASSERETGIKGEEVDPLLQLSPPKKRTVKARGMANKTVGFAHGENADISGITHDQSSSSNTETHEEQEVLDLYLSEVQLNSALQDIIDEQCDLVDVTTLPTVKAPKKKKTRNKKTSVASTIGGICGLVSPSAYNQHSSSSEERSSSSNGGSPPKSDLEDSETIKTDTTLKTPPTSNQERGAKDGSDFHKGGEN